MNSTDTPAFTLIMPAAGIGQRAGGSVAKQYQMLGHTCVLEQTLNIFLALPGLQKAIVALHADDDQFADLDVSQHPKVTTVVGGEERADSVLNALLDLKKDGLDQNSWVLVHDAARPCVQRVDIESMLQQLSHHEVGGIMAVPCSDTLKKVSPIGDIINTVERSQLWQAQTPQMFRFGILLSALQKALDNHSGVTDESSAVELCGYQPVIFQGKRSNIKITQPEDIVAAEQFLSLNGALNE